MRNCFRQTPPLNTSTFGWEKLFFGSVFHLFLALLLVGDALEGEKNESGDQEEWKFRVVAAEKWLFLYHFLKIATKKIPSHDKFLFQSFTRTQQRESRFRIFALLVLFLFRKRAHKELLFSFCSSFKLLIKDKIVLKW